MAGQKIASKGKCCLCKGVFGKPVMTRHLAKCRQEHGAKAETSSEKKSTAFHLVVEGRYLPEYWMHLEVPTKATLERLDGFLRDTWLECCGHLSEFTIEGIRYSMSPMDGFNDKDLRAKLGEVVSPGMKFEHRYDFGSTTRLRLKVVSQLDSDSESTKIRILARNEPPPIVCTTCGEPATQVCTECLYEGKGWLCEKCVRTHKCGDEMLLPVVNSPRVGVCGYTG
jgi:hypothetical protein